MFEENKVKRFIVLSSVVWRKMLQRPHNMARALSRLHQKVIFIEPAFLKLKTNLLDEENLLQKSLNNKRLVEEVTIYTPFFIYIKDQFQYNTTASLVQYLLEDNEFGLETIIITYLPSQVNIINYLKGEYKLVYDCVDDHNDLTYSFWSLPIDLENEINLIDRADIILTSSSALYLTKSFKRKNVFLVKNAVSKSDFKADDVLEIPTDLQKIPAPRIAYLGVVDKWFAEELFYQLAENNQDKSFVIIGPIKQGLLNKRMKNIYYLGLKEHKNLKNYLVNMDVGIIPFKDDIDLIINCNPIKLYEYLACGLPVVSTYLPDLVLNLDFVKACRKSDEFSKVLNQLVNYNIGETELESFLKENSWENRARQILFLIEGKVGEEDKTIQLSRLREQWSKNLALNNSPLLKSMYGLTYAEEDVALFTKLAEEAYQDLKIFYTLQNYIFALYLSDRISEAVEVVLIDENIAEENKAELIFSLSTGNKVHLKLNLLFSIKRFADFKDNLMRIKEKNCPLDRLLIAHYYYATGRYQKAFTIYNQLNLNVGSLNCSPLLNKNMSGLVAENGEYLAAEKYRFQYIKLSDQYLNRENRIQRWANYFKRKVYRCPICGDNIFSHIVKRADKQELINCNNCALVLLKKMPQDDELSEMFNFGLKSGLINDYFFNNANEKKIYEERLNWLNQTIITRSNKRLLNMGWHVGNFLKCVDRDNWECYGLEIFRDNGKAKGRYLVYEKEQKKVNFFSCVTLWDCIGWFTNPEERLREIYNILASHGKLYLTTSNILKGIKEGKGWHYYNSSYQQLYYFEPDTLINILRRSGFKIEDCFSVTAASQKMKDRHELGDILCVSARK